MKYTITTYPNKELFEKTRDIPVDDINSETYGQIGSAMVEIMKDKGGVGLSANQVGLPLNMCVVAVHTNDVRLMLNPRITKRSKKIHKSPEGCLSLPGCEVVVNRYDKVTVEYEDVTGDTQTFEATGMLSNIMQHEIDHLKGILMINRLSEYHKNKALKQVHRFRKIRNGKTR
jgi:peptide deformylase